MCSCTRKFFDKFTESGVYYCYIIYLHVLVKFSIFMFAVHFYLYVPPFMMNKDVYK